MEKPDDDVVAKDASDNVVDKEPSNKNPLNKQLTIVFVLPGNTFTNRFLISWTSLFNYCLSHEITPLVTNHVSDNVYEVYNRCLGGNNKLGTKQKPFNAEIKYDYVMWIDSQKMFNVPQFTELLKHDKDIVSGLYLYDDTKRFNVIEHLDVEYFKQNGGNKYFTPDDLAERRKASETDFLMKVDYTSMGWMLIKHGVFETMKYPWFYPELKECDYTDPSGNLVEHCEYLPPDYCFSKKAKEMGFELFVDTRIIVGNECNVVLG